MILVYVCPFCKEVRIVSRRKGVQCIECGHEMKLSNLTFLEWSEMGQAQRKAYGALWCKRQEAEKKEGTKR